MAYNVLKGTVEGSVDQHGDQEIEGVKVFKNTISASVFYDTDAGEACVTSKDVALSTITGASKNSLITLQDNKTGKAHHNLNFDGNILSAPVINAETIRASAENLTNIPTNAFKGTINAEHINFGTGITDVRGTLQLNLGPGISADEEQITLNLANDGGLSISGEKLTIDASKAHPINSAGQNLSDNDILLVSDVSKGTVASTTLSNLYQNYIHSRVPHATGNQNEIQLRGKRGFASSPKLTYDTNSETLNVENNLKANSIAVDSTLSCAGAIVKNISTITQRNYEVKQGDYTLICDTVKNPINIVIPPACNNVGRILVIKKSNTDKYNLRSYPVNIKTLEGTIDLNDEHLIKTNYSARTLQSDGTTWHIIGSKGT
jgi:hypothetical protein